MYFYQFYLYESKLLKTNNGEPDKTPRSAVSDLGCHSLFLSKIMMSGSFGLILAQIAP